MSCFAYTPENEASLVKFLKHCGLERTRRNAIICFFGDIPEEWNEDREVQLPPDMQVWPCPDHALGH